MFHVKHVSLQLLNHCVILQKTEGEVMYMDEDGVTLATEILAELKASARRWFIAFLVMLGIEVGTVIGFLWYLSLPVEESTVTQSMDNVTDSNALQTVGGDG